MRLFVSTDIVFVLSSLLIYPCKSFAGKRLSGGPKDGIGFGEHHAMPLKPFILNAMRWRPALEAGTVPPFRRSKAPVILFID
jgi:hypothetical protein